MQENMQKASGVQSPSTGDNIVLIGMPGAGKSTIGVVLAKILNYNFVDVDLLIQQRHDQTLQHLIDTFGVEGFIEREGAVLCDIDAHRAIISTGGSAVYSHDAMVHLAKIGRIVYLQVALPELEARLSDFSDRGVVMRGATGKAQQNSQTTLAELYEERTPLYERYAEVTVNIDGLSITDAARKVISALNEPCPT